MKRDAADQTDIQTIHDLLAKYPSRAFTSNELAKRTDIGRNTVNRLLNILIDGSKVVRGQLPNRSYTYAISLVAVPDYEPPKPLAPPYRPPFRALGTDYITSMNRALETVRSRA